MRCFSLIGQLTIGLCLAGVTMACGAYDLGALTQVTPQAPTGDTVASPAATRTRVDLEARADADVQGGAPDVNYGDDPFIHVGNPDKTVFIWFDLSSIPAGATIHRARLMMTATGTGKGPNEVTVGAVQARWRESEITYANQPDVAQSQRTQTVSGAGPVSWNVNPAVEAWLAGEHDNYGLALRGNGPIWGFHSSEGPNPAERPRLRIEYATATGGGAQLRSQR